MLKILAILIPLTSSSFASAGTQNCKGGGGYWHIRSNGITVLGPVKVTFKNSKGVWKGWGKWGSYRSMMLRKKVDGKYVVRRFSCSANTELRIPRWSCREKGVRGSFRFVCYGGDWYN